MKYLDFEGLKKVFNIVDNKLSDYKEELINLYLPISGGTIAKSSFSPLEVKNLENSPSAIRFSNKEGILGYLGLSIKGEPILWDSTAVKTSKLWHEDNFTPSDYLSKDGGKLNVGKILKVVAGNSDTAGRSVGYYIENNDQTPQGAFGCYWDKNIYKYHYIGWGENSWASSNCLAISLDILMYKNQKVWHEGNDGADSGLDADLLDGKQPSELIVGTAKKLEYLGKSTFDTNTVLGDDTNNGKIFVGSGGSVWDNIPSTIGVGNGKSILQIPVSTHSAQFLFSTANSKINFRTGREGLINDWKEIAFTDSNVESSNKIIPKQLTNENLNDILLDAFCVYYGSGSNTCTNKPSEYEGKSGYAFGLIVKRVAAGYYVQQYESADTTIFRRRYNGDNKTWSSWVKLATVESTVTASNKLTAQKLTNEDLNDIKEVGKNYYAESPNSVTNKPSGVGAFNLSVYKTSGTYIQQVLIDASYGKIYTRFFAATAWQPWKKLLMEDDISTLIMRVEELEEKIQGL